MSVEQLQAALRSQLRPRDGGRRWTSNVRIGPRRNFLNRIKRWGWWYRVCRDLEAGR
jgi:hypothetical protein